MIKFVVEHGHVYDNLDDAMRAAKFLAKYHDQVYIKVLVESDRDAWTYGGPNALEEYHRVATAPVEFVEIDRKIVKRIPKMLD